MADIAEIDHVEWFDEMTEAQLMSAMTDLAVQLKDLVVEEVPKRDGNLAKTTIAIPAEKSGDEVVSAVQIGNDQYPYAWAVWRGIPESAGQIHEGNMHFPEEKWPQWTPGGGAEPDANGWFHFKRVKHIVPANDFIGRAINKFLPKIPPAILKRLNFTAGK